MTAGETTPRLHRAMGFRDVVLFLVVAVVGLRWISTAAAVGPSALVIWLIGLAAFFFPLAFTVLELSSRYPEEGGIYVWSKRAFGEFAGFTTGWLYWSSNLVYFPSLLYFAAGNALFMGGPGAQALSHSPAYFIVVSLAGLVLACAVNIVGLRVAKWLHNAGAFGTWIPILVLVAMGVLAAVRFGSATSFGGSALVPAASLKDVVLWSAIAFAFSGFETASLMGEEIVNARRTIPRAIVVSGAVVTGVYLLGTTSVLLALPREEVSGLQGIMQAIARTAERVGLPGIAPAAAALITLSSVGGVGAWLAATARLPFVAGIDRLLPPAFARLHPRWGTPYVALLVQSAGAAAFVVLGQAGTNVKGAYDALTSLAVIVYFIPYLIMFAASIKLQGEPVGPDATRAPGGRPAAVLLAIVGFTTTAASIVLAILPPPDSNNPALAVGKVVGASALLAAIGGLLYVSGKRRSR